MSSCRLCFEFGLVLSLLQESCQFLVCRRLVSLVVLIFCIMELMMVLQVLVVCLYVRCVMECSRDVTRLGFWLTNYLVLRYQAIFPLDLKSLCSFWDHYLSQFCLWMDPVVRFHNIDRSGWHILIDLIDDTHTIISNLFLE